MRGLGDTGSPLTREERLEPRAAAPGKAGLATRLFAPYRCSETVSARKQFQHSGWRSPPLSDPALQDRAQVDKARALSKRGLPSTPSMRRLGIVKGGVRNFQSDGMLDRASIRTRWSSLRTRCSMKFDLAALLSLSRPLRTGRGLAVAANSVCPFALLRFLNLLQSDVLPSLLQSDVPTCLLRCRPFLFALGDFAADSRHTSGRQAARSGDPLSLI